ncbi:MAG: acetyl esterase [Eggerthellaceae bacterium]
MNKLDVLSKINPQMKAVLAKEDELAGDANDTSVGFEKMRENYVAGRAFWCEGGPVMAEKLDAEVDGPYGAIPVRYYYPTAAAAAGRAAGEPAMPAIVYVHGGGFVLGNLDTHDRVCRVLASHAGVPVVAVDYRLSPEAKFPSAVEEVAAVASYLHEQGARHGIDGERLSFAGDSGGAHRLAPRCTCAEKSASDFVKCCLLYYGWFGPDRLILDAPSGGPWDGLTEPTGSSTCRYANDPAELAASPYANLFLNDLERDMPACYIAAAEYDPLRDDSATLAAICEQYGTPVRYEVFEGVIHAFLHYTKMLDAANDALEHGATFYREQLGL